MRQGNKKHNSMSDEHLNIAENNNFIEALESKLIDFKVKMEQKPEIIDNTEDEKVETNPINNADSEEFVNYSSSESEESDEESEASTAIKASNEELNKEIDVTDGNVADKNASPSMRDVSLSPKERYSNQMSTIDKVNLWLPLATGEKGRRTIEVPIDNTKKAALLAAMSEIDKDAENDTLINRFEVSKAEDSTSYNENVLKERKSKLMDQLFGTTSDNQPITQDASLHLVSNQKPLKTSLKTSPSSSSKSVKFVEDDC